MKIKYLCVMCVAGCMAINSCSLEEENPSGGPTVEEYWSTPEGYKKLINGCYYPMSRPLFGGGEDYHLFWAEAGTDLWQGPQGDGWMSPAFTYVGLNAGDGSLGEIWKGPYVGINYCMAAIEFADKSGLPEDEKNAKVAGYRIGGKTGTSEDGVNTNKYVTSFCGVAPIDNPQAVVLVTLYNPTGEGGHQGGGVAA